ncbi:MAG: hypothetical protein K2X81_04555 [Candidatus Obscuribacterales bacterium]|nr:hypothetical protein [Candidatus Obscuribacterales bacterium]
MEVVFAIAILIPSMIILGDLYLLMIGSRENEDLCRNAARAAAAGAPAEANARAGAVVSSTNKQEASPLIPAFKLIAPVFVEVVGQNQDASSEQDKVIAEAMPVNGTVKVTTEVEIKPFLLHVFFGGNKAFRFQAQQSYPISYTPPVGQLDIIH